jgi:hypothetical protein
MSAVPENTAESGTKSISTELANARAIVVLPHPGGPHKTKLDKFPLLTIWRIIPFSPSKSVWPTISSIVAGRIKSANGLVILFCFISIYGIIIVLDNQRFIKLIDKNSLKGVVYESLC